MQVEVSVTRNKPQGVICFYIYFGNRDFEFVPINWKQNILTYILCTCVDNRDTWGEDEASTVIT
jgi:hypothetical protein